MIKVYALAGYSIHLKLKVQLIITSDSTHVSFITTGEVVIGFFLKSTIISIVFDKSKKDNCTPYLRIWYLAFTLISIEHKQNHQKNMFLWWSSGGKKIREDWIKCHQPSHAITNISSQDQWYESSQVSNRNISWRRIKLKKGAKVFAPSKCARIIFSRVPNTSWKSCLTYRQAGTHSDLYALI